MRLRSWTELCCAKWVVAHPPTGEYLVFFKGQHFDSVAPPLYSSSKGQTTQCEALMEEKRVIRVNHGALTVLC